ncbi:Ff.00g084110.m01.CDS01 [Fusarium sp. VM40]|nr:Ff.00g084110.m01.CDS01 [Fusarium sp. VM40]
MSESPVQQSSAVTEYNDRVQDWLLDPGLDIQGRLLGQLSVQPQPSKEAPTNPPPKAHL